MPVEAIFCAREYYTIDALSLIVGQKTQFGLKSHEKLMEDVLAYKTALAGKLAEMLWDYTALAVFGEMRHATGRCSHYNPAITGGNRASAYEEAKKYDPMSILKAGMALFDPKKTSWESSFGGAAWYRIAKCVSKRPIINDGVFCDMCFDLSHNSGVYLNKKEANIFTMFCAGYTTLLNFKRDEHDIERVVKLLYQYATKTLKKLVDRAVVLKMIDKQYSLYYFGSTSYSPDMQAKAVFEYNPIYWEGVNCEDTIIEHAHYYNEDEEENEGEEDEGEYEVKKAPIDQSIGWLDSFFYSVSTAKNNSKRGAA